MVNKSIGAFISVLRRSQGMTQRELAEKLGVSDKTISHWERDETAPDLTTIPVLAEIFGVSCDELLRGERMSRERTEDPPPQKGEKQLKRILFRIVGKSRMINLIALGVASVGYIGALIANFAFLRARLGFFIGVIFYVVSGIVSAAGFLSARHGTDGEEFDKEAVRSAREALYKSALRIAYGIVLFIAVTLPLIMFAFDAYIGIAFSSYVKYASIFLIFAAGLCFGVNKLITDNFIESGRFVPTESEIVLRRRTNWLAGITAAVMLLTLFAQGVYNAGAPESLLDGQTFESFEEFREYAETPMERETYLSYADSGSVPVEVFQSDITYYDMNGVEISAEEALRQEVIIDSTYYTWIQYNHNIARWSFSVFDDEVHVTAYTWADYERARETQQVVNQAYIIGYALELLTAVLVWMYLRYTSSKKTGL